MVKKNYRIFTGTHQIQCEKFYDIKLFMFSCSFDISNTDHIIDVNQAVVGHQYDQINIICPYYPAVEGGQVSGSASKNRSRSIIRTS